MLTRLDFDHRKQLLCDPARNAPFDVNVDVDCQKSIHDSASKRGRRASAHYFPAVAVYSAFISVESANSKRSEICEG